MHNQVEVGEKVTVYQSSECMLTGESYRDLERKARTIHNAIARKTKRNTYVRSVYFKKSKIFIKLFWEHLNQKSQHDRRRRLKYYAAAIDLLQHSSVEPVVKQNPNSHNQVLYRFSGLTKDGAMYFVQVKEDLHSNNKYFMSVFPPK